MKNLIMAAALGATALVPLTVHAQTTTQPAQTQQQPAQTQQQPTQAQQPMQTQQTGQMQEAQIQQMAVSDLMDREVVSEQGEPVGTVAGVVQREGEDPLVVIEMQQDQTRVLLPMDRISIQDDQIVAEGMQGGQLADAQQFDEQQQAEYQPVEQQQEVPVRMQMAETQQPMQEQTAQTTVTEPTTTQPVTAQPMTTEPTTTEPVTAQPQMAAEEELELQGGFVASQGPNQIMGSNLMDADVIGATGENIGKVSNLLMNSEGRVVAIIVGVGGFLGIGERDVAIPVDALNFVTAEVAAAATTGEPVATGTLSEPSPMTPPGMAEQQPRDTATTGTGWGWGGEDVLQHIEVAFTREQLEAAPEFVRLGEER